MRASLQSLSMNVCEHARVHVSMLTCAREHECVHV